LFAVIFTFVFGDQSPFTYAFSATCTIILCTRLNLQVGTTVATLTAMAMIPGIHDAYYFNFFSRLLTAIIGLVTAGLLKFLFFFPKYYYQLNNSITFTVEKKYAIFIHSIHKRLIVKI